MNLEPPPCTLCGSPSVAQVYLPQGCIAYPGEREQELCAQHLLTIEPLEMYTEITIHDPVVYALVTS